MLSSLGIMFGKPFLGKELIENRAVIVAGVGLYALLPS